MSERLNNQRSGKSKNQISKGNSEKKSHIKIIGNSILSGIHERGMKKDENIKVGTSPFKKICFNDSPSKMMKSAFYFILRLFSLSRYLNLCLDFLGM